MKHAFRSRKTFVLIFAVGMLSTMAAAQNNFKGGEITNVANWTGGVLPTTPANAGTIASNGVLGAITNYYITQTNGAISRGSNLSTAHEGGEWNLNGGSYTTRALSIRGACAFAINGGTADLGNNNRDVRLDGGSTLIVSGGATDMERDFQIVQGTFTISSGTFDVGRWFGCKNFQTGGEVNFNGGVVTASGLEFGTTALDFNFGGTAVGSLTATNFGGDRHDDSRIQLDFLSGTRMTLSLTNAPSTWAEDQWNAGRLLYDGQSSNDLGVSWATATSYDGLGNFYRFDFDGTNLMLLNEAPASGILFRIR